METVKIDILNPKAKKLLENLADLKLIKINIQSKSDFSQIIKRIRANSKKKLSLKEITKEVENIRSSRYEK